MNGGISKIDIALGVRMVAKRPGLSLIGVVAIMMATAVGATAFEVFSEVMGGGLSLPAGERVVAIHYATDNPGNPERRVLHDLVDWQELESVEALGAFRTAQRVLVDGENQAVPIVVAEITASGFELARTPPLLGRYLLLADETVGGVPVVVLGHDLWQSRFAGDHGIVGRTIDIGGVSHQVVGVMPEGFEFPLYHQAWVPLRADPAEHERLRGPALFVFGRLAPGFELEEAQAELTAVSRRTAAAYPELYERLRLRVLPYPREHLLLDIPEARQLWWISQLVLTGLLLVVLANVAILVYARTVARQNEIALRSALGASRTRILVQLFVEALVLASIGAAGGVLLAQLLLATVQSRIDLLERLPFWVDLNLSAGTALYGLALAVLAAVVVGVVPGVKATGRRLHGTLRQSGVGTAPRLGRIWTFLIVAQVAIAVAVLPGALATIWRLVQIELSGPGFAADRVVLAEAELKQESLMSPVGEGDGEAFAARVRDRYFELRRRLESEPGVDQVALASRIPLFELARSIELEGEMTVPQGGTPSVFPIEATPGLFDVYGAEIVAGRVLHTGDGHDAARPVVVNRTFVERILGNKNAVGRRFYYRQPPSAAGGERPKSYEIVGVVSDFPNYAPLPGRDRQPKIYHPMVPGTTNPVYFLVRFAGPVPQGFVGRLRQIGVEVDPELLLQVQPLTNYYEDQLSPIRSGIWVLAFVMVSVLLLSAAGIHALMSFTVAQGTREIGIRIAIGAPSRKVLLGVFYRVIRQLTVGVGIGVLLATTLFALLGSDSGRSMLLVASVAGIMTIVGLLAALGPARRSLRIEPTEALREA